MLQKITTIFDFPDLSFDKNNHKVPAATPENMKVLTNSINELIETVNNLERKIQNHVKEQK